MAAGGMLRCRAQRRPAVARARAGRARARGPLPPRAQRRDARGRKRAAGVVVRGAACCPQGGAPAPATLPAAPPGAGGPAPDDAAEADADAEDEGISADANAAYEAPPRVRALLEGEGWTATELRAQREYERAVVEERARRMEMETRRRSGAGATAASVDGRRRGVLRAAAALVGGARGPGAGAAKRKRAPAGKAARPGARRKGAGRTAAPRGAPGRAGGGAAAADAAGAGGDVPRPGEPRVEEEDREVDEATARLRDELVESKLERLREQRRHRAPYELLDRLRMRLFSFRNEADTGAIREAFAPPAAVEDPDGIAEYSGSLGAVPLPSVAARLQHVRVDGASLPALVLLFGGALGACASVFLRRRREGRTRLKVRELEAADRARRSRVRRDLYVKKARMHRMRAGWGGGAPGLAPGDVAARGGVTAEERRGEEEDEEEEETRDWMYLTPREASRRSRRRNLERLREDPFHIRARGAPEREPPAAGGAPEGGDAHADEESGRSARWAPPGDALPRPAFGAGPAAGRAADDADDADDAAGGGGVLRGAERTASSPALSVSLSSSSPSSPPLVEVVGDGEGREPGPPRAPEVGGAPRPSYGPEAAPARSTGKMHSDGFRRQMATTLSRQRVLRDEAARALQERGLVPVQVPEELSAWWRAARVVYVIGSREDRRPGRAPRPAPPPSAPSGELSLFQVNLSPDPMLSSIPHCLGFASAADAAKFVDFLCALPPEDRELALPSAYSRPVVLPRPPGDLEEICREQGMGATVLPAGALSMRPGWCLGDLLNALGHNDGVRAVVSEYMDRQLRVMQTLGDGAGDELMASPGLK